MNKAFLVLISFLPLTADAIECDNPAAICPNCTLPFNCFVNPCTVVKCPALPEAECRTNYCEGCSAHFFIGDKEVTDHCSDLPNPSVPTTNLPQSLSNLPSQTKTSSSSSFELTYDTLHPSTTFDVFSPSITPSPSCYPILPSPFSYDPCERAFCPKYPNAVCIPEGHNATFHVRRGRQEVTNECFDLPNSCKRYIKRRNPCYSPECQSSHNGQTRCQRNGGVCENHYGWVVCNPNPLCHGGKDLQVPCVHGPNCPECPGESTCVFDHINDVATCCCNDPLATCPNCTLPFNCSINPCTFVKCPALPEAECRTNFCEGCLALFFIGDKEVTDHCSDLPNPSVPTTDLPLSLSNLPFQTETSSSSSFELTYDTLHPSIIFDVSSPSITPSPSCYPILPSPFSYDPCERAFCPRYPDAVCIPEGHTATFHVRRGRQEVTNECFDLPNSCKRYIKRRNPCYSPECQSSRNGQTRCQRNGGVCENHYGWVVCNPNPLCQGGKDLQVPCVHGPNCPECPGESICTFDHINDVATCCCNDPLATCPNCTLPFNCSINPCTFVKCPALPEAECRTNFCEGCLALFFIGDKEVTDHCSDLPNPSVPTIDLPLSLSNLPFQTETSSSSSFELTYDTLHPSITFDVSSPSITPSPSCYPILPSPFSYDPCERAFCPRYPDAVCIPEGHTATFHVRRGRQEVTNECFDLPNSCKRYIKRRNPCYSPECQSFRNGQTRCQRNGGVCENHNGWVVCNPNPLCHGGKDLQVPCVHGPNCPECPGESTCTFDHINDVATCCCNDPLATCPNCVYPSVCTVDPCRVARCPNVRRAECESNRCGGCTARFFTGRGENRVEVTDRCYESCEDELCYDDLCKPKKGTGRYLSTCFRRGGSCRERNGWIICVSEEFHF